MVGGPVRSSSSRRGTIRRPAAVTFSHQITAFRGRKLPNEAVSCSTPGADCSRWGLSCERETDLQELPSPQVSGFVNFPPALDGRFHGRLRLPRIPIAPPLPSPPRRPYCVFIPCPCTTDQSESEMKICRKPTFCHAESFRGTVRKIGLFVFNQSSIE